jgi:hypothetical protein
MSLVKFDADGNVSIDGNVIPNNRIEFVKEANDIGQIVITAPIFEGEQVEGEFEVALIVELLSGFDTIRGRGRTRAGALRDLADKMDGQP